MYFVLSFKSYLYDANLIQGIPNRKSHGNSLFFLFIGIKIVLFKILRYEKDFSSSYGCMCNKRLCN